MIFQIISIIVCNSYKLERISLLYRDRMLRPNINFYSEVPSHFQNEYEADQIEKEVKVTFQKFQNYRYQIIS